MRKQFAAIFMAILLTPLLGSAQAQPVASGSQTKQPLSEWTNLSVLTPGQKIEIVEKSRTKHRGGFVLLTDTSISIREAAGEGAILRQDVRSVKVKKGRLRHAAIWGIGGAAAGVGAGVLLTNAASKTDPSASSSDAGIIAGGVIGAIVGLLAGAGVGSLIPAYRALYISP
jgi:hypothetical protein